MGSYLSIVNNTDDPWTCKIGPDEAALEIAGVAISVVGTLASALGTGGVAPVASALAANGVVKVFGVSAKALASSAEAISEAISAAGSVSEFGLSVAQGINDHLVTDGYVRSLPGTCVRTTIVDEKTVITDTLYMRPIFSGATDNSNLDHEIQFWIDKFGLETETVSGTPDQQSRHHHHHHRHHHKEGGHHHKEGGHHHHHHHKDGEQQDGQVVYFYGNDTNTYDPSYNYN
ncbi:hypothetical protein GN244_ATG02557 [Phytophthora infestans]|uniref:Uncharacterized protein n=1 Tax=Phytophthora infestans TaxID=4787 RepID=A0A833T890_PHYIN|nr:hypothetical protein GN244_ATG02557 [Phytophthora infestans]